MNRILTANRDLARRLDAHLFVICPNDSGSSFLLRALETCRMTWRLPREGIQMHGYAGPLPTQPHGPDGWIPGLLWAAEPRWIDLFADPRNYDWPCTRKAWHFHAFAADPRASVFVTKSPPHVLCVGQLLRHFANARFLFMVRNPYAVAEGICRYYRSSFPPRYLAQFREHGKCLAEAAADPCGQLSGAAAAERRGVGTFGRLLHLRADVRRAGDGGRRDPHVGAAARRPDPAPAHPGEELRRNADGHERAALRRLQADDLAAFNRVFRAHGDTLAHFGYEWRA